MQENYSSVFMLKDCPVLDNVHHTSRLFKDFHTFSHTYKHFFFSNYVEIEIGMEMKVVFFKAWLNVFSTNSSSNSIILDNGELTAILIRNPPQMLPIFFFFCSLHLLFFVCALVIVGMECESKETEHF